MKVNNKTNLFVQSIFLRYILALLLAFNGLFLFYLVLTPLTIYPVFFILKIFFKESILNFANNSISIENLQIDIIKPCIAGSAYYLLTLLNFLTPMLLRTRIRALFYSLLILLVINIARIVIFVFLIKSEFIYFDIIHELTWNLLSTLIVVLIWFSTIKIFKIDTIPIYTDIKNILKQIRN